MNVPRYRITALGDTRDALRAMGRETFWDIAAFNMQSAWAKFQRQRFGALAPNPADYDISLMRDASPMPLGMERAP